jgi:hypothetical protein
MFSSRVLQIIKAKGGKMSITTAHIFFSVRLVCFLFVPQYYLLKEKISKHEEIM